MRLPTRHSRHLTDFTRLATIDFRGRSIATRRAATLPFRALCPGPTPPPTAAPHEAYRPPHHRRFEFGKGVQPSLPTNPGSHRLLLACVEMRPEHPSARSDHLTALLSDDFALFERLWLEQRFAGDGEAPRLRAAERAAPAPGAHASAMRHIAMHPNFRLSRFDAQWSFPSSPSHRHESFSRNLQARPADLAGQPPALIINDGELPGWSPRMKSGWVTTNPAIFQKAITAGRYYAGRGGSAQGQGR